jgi:dipeptidyl aminopeptidase/acylaminoacyl peptidase
MSNEVKAMTDQSIAPYGAWRSPITAEMLAEGGIGLGEVMLDGDAIYWTEARPTEAGRSVIVRWTAEMGAMDMTPPGFNARTRVHEYGGGAYWVDESVVYFANFDDQILYRQTPGAAPVPLTPVGYRYADGVVDRARNRIICVREDHTTAGQEATNTLVAIDCVAGGAGEVLASGYDFYSTPRLSPDGTQLCWLAWRHPNMPWTATELWLAEIAPNGALRNARCIEGDQGGESIFQPAWAPDGQLTFVSDRTDWWNLYRWTPDGALALAPLDAEFGAPQWGLAMATYGFLDAETAICSYVRDGSVTVARLDLVGGTLEPLYAFSTVRTLRVNAACAAFVAGAPTESMAIMHLNLASGALQPLRYASILQIDPAFLSAPEVVDFPTSDGVTAHAFYYAPHNPLYRAPAGELPPLIVFSHGGPTGTTTSTLDLDTQFWTSRGFGVLDVNYRGSSGYGRRYRELLNGQWGVADVEDCIAGARFLAEQRRVDGRRLLIRGGSAGGYTTLMALVSSDVFAAGASYFGVSDAEALALETHKFESRYLDWLIGPYPERRDLYLERSPITHVDKLNSPAIFFQGLDDKVVLPNQAEMMVEALRKKGIPVAYVAYAGEGHGFRRAENIIYSQQAELSFYAQVLGFTPADELPEIKIENLPHRAGAAE